MNKILVFLSVVVLSQCAKNLPPPQGTALLPEIDVVQVKENSDEALRLAQEAKLDVEALNSKVTELGNQIASLTEDIANISVAKIEEIENRVAVTWEELRALQKMLEGVELKKKVAPPPPPATFKPSAAAQQTSNPQMQKVDNVKAGLRGGNHEAYQSALRAYNSRDYAAAIKQFKILLEDDTKGTYADNSTFWIGECFYMIGDFAQAVAWYKKVFQYTDTEKADDAQYKVAKSFARLGESSQAVAEYERMLSLYPSSEYVGRAKSDLQKLKNQ